VAVQRHRLLLAWVRMRTGRYDTAVAELARLAGAALPGREQLVLAATDAAADVGAVCDQIITHFEAERAALADPAKAQRMVDDLSATRQRVEALKSSASKWSQTLADGIADLNSDIDHDLRSRIRVVLQEADDSVETVDPADMWPQMESWLQSRVSYELLSNYTMLRERADALSADVAEHFRAASGEIFDRLAVYNPTALVRAGGSSTRSNWRR
jgi:hypothetical protein